MPIENEIKILLRDSKSLREFLETLPRSNIEQYYCDGGRVRKIEGEYIFTFKKILPDKTNLEIETFISFGDFEHFVSIATHELIKTRYYFQNCEIDDFGDGLIICEIEGNNQKVPEELSPFIKKFIEKGLKKYSSKSLAKKINE